MGHFLGNKFKCTGMFISYSRVINQSLTSLPEGNYVRVDGAFESVCLFVCRSMYVTQKLLLRLT